MSEPASILTQVEQGERVLNPAETAAVNNFNTEGIETKMGTLVSELNAANKTLNSMVNGVNTLVAVNSRQLEVNKQTARKVGGQVGLV